MTFVLVGWCAVAIGFTVTALLKVRRVRAASPAALREVVLLRPVDAPTDVELQNLAAVPSGVVQHILSPSPLADSAREFVTSDPRGFNRKLGHLHNALATVDVTAPVLIADADVRVDAALVNALLSGLEAGAALAWAAPSPQQPGVERGLLVQSAHSFEVLDAISPGSSPLCGKAMALSPAAIEVLRALPDCVGEDLELSEALHRRGLRTALVGRATLPGQRALSSSFARFTRWMQVLRAHRAALFPTVPLLFACTPLLLAASFVSPLTQALAAVLFFTRLALATRLEGRPSLWWFAGELLLLASWCAALAQGSRVMWRGRVLHIARDGRLVESPR